MEVPVSESALSESSINFKNFYKWLFFFVKGDDTSQKVIEPEVSEIG